MTGYELLSPAGDAESLDAAILYGADAVYLAGGEFGMRAGAANFKDIKSAVEKAHASGVRVYVTVNTMPRNDEAARLPSFLEELNRSGADAAIVADPGVLAMIKRYAPALKAHISTQASVMNYESARAWKSMGADRIVLARELTLKEISEIRAKTPPELELEAFAHGSMCMAYSGRCFLSNYLTGRDANRGACAQPCRWKYSLVEQTRAGEYMDVTEDGGAYILNSKDLRMIDRIGDMAEAGITSFKLEGRAKTAYYTAGVTNAYRMAVDLYKNKKEFEPWLLDETEKISHREYWTGFYFGETSGQHTADSIYIREWEQAAAVLSCDGEGNALLSQRNKFYADESLEIMLPSQKPVSFVPGYMTDGDGNQIENAAHPVMDVRLRLPLPVASGTMLRRKK